jgi:NAD(P)H-quinone oxidoreductase subunit 4
MEILSKQSYPLGLSILLYLGFLIAFAVKLPAFPFHTWLPDTHGEAHYSTCMLLAGILLKMGGYGFIRINIEILSDAHKIFAPWLVALGAGQIVYAALVSIAQRNLKRRIAYSSISHMGFVLIGAGSFSDLGLSGAILQMVSHGLIGAGLFFLAGTAYDRSCTLILDEMGGWGSVLPKTFSTFTACAMASLALPGMSGFVAELMIFLGIVTSSFYSPLFKAIITLIEGIGIILTPIYLLSMLRKMFFGYTNISLKTIKDSLKLDASPREVFIIFSLLLPILGIGFYPDFSLQLWKEKTQEIFSLAPTNQQKITLISSSFRLEDDISFIN